MAFYIGYILFTRVVRRKPTNIADACCKSLVQASKLGASRGASKSGLRRRYQTPFTCLPGDNRVSESKFALASPGSPQAPGLERVSPTPIQRNGCSHDEAECLKIRDHLDHAHILNNFILDVFPTSFPFATWLALVLATSSFLHCAFRFGTVMIFECGGGEFTQVIVTHTTQERIQSRRALWVRVCVDRSCRPGRHHSNFLPSNLSHALLSLALSRTDISISNIINSEVLFTVPTSSLSIVAS